MKSPVLMKLDLLRGVAEQIRDAVCRRMMTEEPLWAELLWQLSRAECAENECAGRDWVSAAAAVDVDDVLQYSRAYYRYSQIFEFSQVNGSGYITVPDQVPTVTGQIST